MGAGLKSNLDIVKESDNFPYYSDSPSRYKEAIREYYHFQVADCDVPLGYVPAAIVHRLPNNELWKVDKEQHRLTFDVDGSDLDRRNKLLAESLQALREQKLFSILSGWRNELYPIYGPGRKLLLTMERSASPLFGVVTYGVHLTAFVRTEEGMKIWVPKRADTKQTYPGMMDNTVAGGLSTGETPFDCLIREAQEEASLPEEVARKAKACGTLTYFHLRGERAGGETGLCQPECQYIYDLELPPDVILKPGDNEAVDFRLLSVKEVMAAMAEGRFKPNCAHLLVEFFVRHGFITAENEPDYIEIVERCHRKLEFPMA